MARNNSNNNTQAHSVLSGISILYINNPQGVGSSVRRTTLDALRSLNEMNYRQSGDPETHTRIQEYELAYRMQTSVPELTDLGLRIGIDLRLYGEAARKPGTFANTVLRPGGWSSGACGSCRSITTTGTRTPTSPAVCPTSAATSTRPPGA